MPFTIDQRVFFSGTKMLVRQEFGEFTRPLGIGNNWNTIRIALLCAIRGTYQSTQNLAIPWAIGLCNGMGSGWGQKYTNHFVGWGGGTGTPLQTYIANSGNPYYVHNGFGMRKVGFTTTTASIGSTNINMPSTEGTFARKGVVIVDIVKGFTSICYSTATSGMAFQNDVQVGEFLNVVQNPNNSQSLQGIALAATSNQTLSGSESAGSLDTLDISWGSNITPLEIYAMAVYRML